MRIRFWISVIISSSILISSHAMAALSPKAYCSAEEKSAYIPISQRIENKGFLFIAYHCDHAPSYILGTIHSDNPQVAQQSALAFKALSQSSIALFEVVADETAQSDLMSLIISMDPNASLQRTIGFVQFERLKRLIKSQSPELPEELLEKYYPWSASILLQVPKPKGDGISLDEQLQSAAMQHNIPLKGLETTREQFAAFTALTPEENNALLKDTLDNIMMIRKMDAQLETYYLRRDMQHILELSTSAYQEIEDPVLREKLVQGVLHARNTTLFSRAVPELAKGNGFLAVGVLHLLHDDGILAQMENAGYAIFPASSR